MSDTRPQGQPDEAMVDLPIKQVTEGLSPAEQRALDVLDSEVASAYLRDLERAAAAVTLAGSASDGAVARRLGGSGSRSRPRNTSRRRAMSPTCDRRALRRADAGARCSNRRAGVAPAGIGGYGWLAAAACLVLAIFGWERSPPPPPRRSPW